MDPAALLNRWLQAKLAHQSYYRLRQPKNVAFEWKGPRMGHPSNYAAVTFACSPSETFGFSAALDIRTALPFEPHNTTYEEAILEAVLDCLIARFMFPYWGIKVVLTDVGWDMVSSSPVAFYIATSKAMGMLLDDGEWEYCTKNANH